MISSLEKPYIGVTGFKTLEDVYSIKTFVEQEEVLSLIPHQILFGFICSDKRLADKSSSGKNSPPLADLKELIEIASESPAILPTIHYSTSKPDLLWAEVTELFRYLDFPNKRLALQINSPWPDPQQVSHLEDCFPGLELILHTPPHDPYSFNAAEMAKKCAAYPKLEYLVIDCFTQNFEFDLNYCVNVATEIVKTMPNVRLGVVGNFGADTIAAYIGQIQSHFHSIQKMYCIDACNKLYDGNRLDLNKTKEYIKTAALTLKQHHDISHSFS